MYISELELHGFKSFAQKTRVRFDSGVTAIVGPNGCGKSNIVDALRWVLGEQRPTLLRSSSMNDVVFNGTATKKALGMAEVSLTLINNKGVLPTEYSDVTITRRLYRSGQSEYLLNQTVCRLKDIMDLFMDTGMGADAYSVIELKMVEEILSDKNNERRRLFEEAAGVTRYKEKRRLTLKRLGETMADLQRVEDIVVEVRKKTRSLELQSQRAEKAKTFREELERLDHQFTLHDYQGIHRELKPLLEQITQLEKERITIQSELEALEGRDDLLRRELLEAEKAQAEARKEVDVLARRQQELQTAIRVANEQILAEEKVIEQYHRDLTQGETDIRELESVMSASIHALEELDVQLQDAERILEESRAGFRTIQQDYAKVRESLMEAEIDASKAETTLRDLQTEQVRLESRMESAAGDQSRSRQDLDALLDRIAGMRRELEMSETAQAAAEGKVQVARKELEDLLERRTTLEAAREEQREAVRAAISNIDGLERELSLLKDLEASRDGFPEGVSHLRESEAGRFSRIDLLSDLIQTEERFAAAVAAAMGPALHALVVGSMTDASLGMDLLRASKKGRAMFIPVDEFKGGRAPIKGSLAEHVDCDPSVRPVIDLLLGQTAWCETLEQAPKAWSSSIDMVVTLEGERYVRHQSVEGGSANSSQGIRLSLKDRITKLEKKIGQAGRDHRKLAESLEQTETMLASLDTAGLRMQVEQLQQELADSQREVNRLESGIQVHERNASDLKARLEQMDESEGTTRSELQSLAPRQTSLREDLVQRQEHLSGLKERLQVLDEERSIQQNRFNNAQLKHQDVRNRVENLETERRRAEQGLVTLRQRLDTRGRMIKVSSARIDELRKGIDADGRKLEALGDVNAKAVGALGGTEELSSIKRGEIHALEKELRDLRNRKDLNVDLLHLQQLTRDKKEMQAKALSDHIWDTYGLLMSQLAVEIPEDFDADAARGRISELRQSLNRIGEVNPLAIEEYREEKERLDFMEEQIRDLKQAESQLQATIDEINNTAVERFQTTFEEIRSHFKKVFSTLFKENDTCDLIIDEDAADPLDARIEIRANPSGKRPSGISQLSGGEKTLTAIALLFAIYLVKPSPFCVLDEVDAPLDDANIERFSDMIRSFSRETQFIIITHNKKTMSKAEMMYGVTMPETGVSRLVGVKLNEMEG